ncbi:uncharacterized protein PHALS_14824 [Plasmopara halstedii]|uniref:Uncharacterized protein n=1 Tax=Plasmopara halstedii TaxID=4781 RepID=A0A0P1AW68_PLAHL|nr:uncharacterized protein PHALS_14824 [Plasmopara halstedii]CEG45606.1 hypothetical protein PHALS_14824 [Plasmopara halstedii]|eukprot:XP_024581975.1 hypothetical protein PHALS_14824 [Plasmopara halstedii]
MMFLNGMSRYLKIKTLVGHKNWGALTEYCFAPYKIDSKGFRLKISLCLQIFPNTGFILRQREYMLSIHDDSFAKMRHQILKHRCCLDVL